MANTKAYWSDTYSSKGDNVSWYQPTGGRSLDMIRNVAPSHKTSIIDVGSGSCRLADDLLASGYSDLTLLDISETALNRTKARIGETSNVQWIVEDVCQWNPNRTWDVWHDRAVFHFLVDTREQDAYIAALKQATELGSSIILSTFALTGPDKCSGLPVQRYSIETLTARLGSNFELYTEGAEQHRTPSGIPQDFIYAGFRRR